MIDHIHDTPGRLRVRCSALRKNQTKAAALKTHLVAVPGVTAVHVNPHTGSVTTYYDPAVTRPAVLINIMNAHGFTLVVVPAHTAAGEPATRSIRVAKRKRHGTFTPPGLAKTAAAFLLEKAIERSLMAIVAAVL